MYRKVMKNQSVPQVNFKCNSPHFLHISTKLNIQTHSVQKDLFLSSSSEIDNTDDDKDYNPPTNANTESSSDIEATTEKGRCIINKNFTAR